jgi:methionyl-tRNA formyltransferase
MVIGSVKSTAVTIQALVRHQMNIIGILGHEPLHKEKISGWFDLKSLAIKNNINYKCFNKINDKATIGWAAAKKPDIIFAVGFSQLLSDEWLNLPSLGCIGFHPTCLPRGRGRAPMAWIVLEERCGSATFFLMGKGIDDGPIFVQNIFQLDENDDAGSVETKIIDSMNLSLDDWLPSLKKGIWNPIPQDDSGATWFGKRNQEDGLIEWNREAQDIDRLIKASSRPHPGAYTYFNNNKLIVWSSNVEDCLPIKGVTGRILLKDKDGNCLVQCGSGLIWIREKEFAGSTILKVGDKLGYSVEDEIHKIWNELNKLIKNE